MSLNIMIICFSVLQALEAFPADQLVCGALCIAMSEAHYYRCRIVDSTLPLVQFIDYGEVQEVKLEDVCIYNLHGCFIICCYVMASLNSDP